MLTVLVRSAVFDSVDDAVYFFVDFAQGHFSEKVVVKQRVLVNRAEFVIQKLLVIRIG